MSVRVRCGMGTLVLRMPVGLVSNFARRLAQLDTIATLDSLNNVEVWLGGLFFPEAYITATRQAVAHRKRWSLETLRLELDLEKVNDPGAFIVDGACQWQKIRCC